MKQKHFLYFLAAVVAGISLSSCSPKGGDEDSNMEPFIRELMSKMTLEEKLGQLNLPASDDIVTGETKDSNIARMVAEGKVGGVFNVKGVEKIQELQRVAVEESRLGIPLIFGMDVIHGYETIFPIPLALSCSWDTIAIKESARVAAKEASAGGICWTFSPMVDICRDPRWGRASEGSGEDPFLGAAIARVMVEGYQGKNLENNDEIMACVKHFALYGAPEGGRDYNTVDMSRQRMFNDYFAPYKAGAEAGAGSFMTSFNTIDGVPATANRWLLTDVLRGMWGFEGFIVTDYTAISEMIEHGLGDLQQVSAMALKAGTDMDMVADGFNGTLSKSLDEGLVNMGQIDAAVRRILEAKYKLGLFKDPYKYISLEREKSEIYTSENRNLSRKIATETFVLLKNDNNLLPLEKKGRIAVIGPLSNTRANMPGTWSVAADAQKYKTLYEGIRDAVGDKGQVSYAKGSNLTADAELEANATMFGRGMRDGRSEEVLRAEAVSLARNSDVIIAALGESSEFSGESSSRSDISLPETQRKLLEALLATGKPVVMLNFAGRPTILSWESENVPAILNVWFGGSEAADAIADVVFGDVSPSGKLTMSMPRNMGQIPIYYNHLNTGRPKAQDEKFEKFRSGYIDSPNSPLYPFGFGLSYTTFDYSEVRLSGSQMNQDGLIKATVDVTNTGQRDGDEIVELYIRDLVGSTSRPLKELKGFKRIHLKAGETKQVEFTITADLLKFYNYELEYVAEPGEFSVMIGPDSENLNIANFMLK
ncbi:MAG: beta-glucosidase BglX [Muribaculaceae bacterium]|nr:beta-glucosidase BglX [Muribaculaceae bacterium]